MQSEDKVERLLAVTLLGAIDDLPRTAAGLADAKHADIREHTVLVFRNWMGRGPGQAEKLYEAMLTEGKLTKIQAAVVVQLLFGFDQEERRDPATYQFLIELLSHKRIGVRELAHWHLVRLAPAGKELGYDAGAADAQRDKAIAQWRAVIPPGRLPPPPKVQKKTAS